MIADWNAGCRGWFREKMGAPPLAGKGWKNFLLIEESFGKNEVKFRLSEVNSAIAQPCHNWRY